MIVKKVENSESVKDVSIILFLEAEKKALIPCKRDYTANRLEVQLFQPELHENKTKKNSTNFNVHFFPPCFLEMSHSEEESAK